MNYIKQNIEITICHFKIKQTVQIKNTKVFLCCAGDIRTDLKTMKNYLIGRFGFSIGLRKVDAEMF